MLRSNVNSENSDFNLIKDPQHVEMVWKVIEKNIPIKFEQITKKSSDFKQLANQTDFVIKESKPDIRKRLVEIFEKGREPFIKERPRYLDFFDEETMQEFEDEGDPKLFKSSLSTKIPVILKARNSKMEGMKEWQQKYAAARPADICDTFFNLMNFKDDYISSLDDNKYFDFEDIKDFDFLAVLNDDDDYNVPGVIGMGIKSLVLYFLNPKYFLGANKNNLYGYYFLSECDSFQLPSRTNEFTMVNDLDSTKSKRFNKNHTIDQNYWYPYDKFMLYSLRTYKLLDKLCKSHGYTLNDEYRYVNVHCFMTEVCNLHSDTISTMMGGGENEIL